jgi:hypothetical protein
MFNRLPRYSIASPVTTSVGQLSELASYAGISCARINDVLPAARIVRDLGAEHINPSFMEGKSL